MPAAVRGLALALAAALLGSCADAPRAGRSRPNFVLVMVDTLRLDHLRFAGNSRQQTPRFDALKAESVWFSQAWANSSWTLPSLASLFTSQLSSEHGLTLWGASLDAAHTTLPERLQAAGYRTGSWSANVLIDADVGFDQGFHEYRSVLAPKVWGDKPLATFPNAEGAQVTSLALSWLRGLAAADPDIPFFAYLHFMEPHTPYRCLGSAACRAGAEVLNQRLLAGDTAFTPEEVAVLRGLYAGEVQHMDTELGRLLDGLEQSGLMRDTWVIVTADHGEQLGETGLYLHGESLEPQELRIPLLFRSPDGRAAVVDTPVSLLDVAPTLLELAGIARPAGFRGRSLVAALRGGALPARPVVAELHPRRGVAPRHHLAVVSGAEMILQESGGALRRFDVRRDPYGRRARSATPAQLTQALGALAGELDLSRELPTDLPPLDAAAEVRLRALGYGR